MQQPYEDSDIQIQNQVYNLLQERPEFRRALAEMVAWEEEHPSRSPYDGWETEDVHTAPWMVNHLISAGIVNRTSKSRAYRHHRLVSSEATAAALADMAAPITSDSQPIDVDSLFILVVGHQKVKELLRFAVKADKPVHCLLYGPPGTAKTLLLSDLGNLPGAQFYVGSTTTKAGLLGLLLQAKPKFLVIDELDKMDARDMSPLLNLMETGMVTRLQHGHQERVTLETKVFAGANEIAKISPPIVSRFAKFEIPPYAAKQFIEVAKMVLQQREGQGPEMALHIATEVVKYSLDIRDAVRVARMSRRDPRRVMEVIACLWPQATITRIRPV